MSATSSVADRRLHPREAASEKVRLVTPSGHVYDAQVVDRSFRGLRVQLDEASKMPAEVTVLSRASGVVHVAKVVWRSAPFAGLSITGTTDMRTAAGPESAALHKLWREHIGR